MGSGQRESLASALYQPLLLLQVIDPNICQGGETIAVIPVRVSAQAVFSKYSIHPASLINFGTLTSGTKKTCTFTLENKGILYFKFLISRAEQDTAALPRKR